MVWQNYIHLSIHLVPRRKGDTANPKGGVRGVWWYEVYAADWDRVSGRTGCYYQGVEKPSGLFSGLEYSLYLG